MIFLGSGDEDDVAYFCHFIQLLVQSLTRKPISLFESTLKSIHLYLKLNLPQATWLTAVVHKNMFRYNQRKSCFRIKYHCCTGNCFMESYRMAVKRRSSFYYTHLDRPKPPPKRRPLRRRLWRLAILLNWGNVVHIFYCF